MRNEWVRTWKEAVSVCFKVLADNFPGRTYENSENQLITVKVSLSTAIEYIYMT